MRSRLGKATKTKKTHTIDVPINGNRPVAVDGVAGKVTPLEAEFQSSNTNFSQAGISEGYSIGPKIGIDFRAWLMRQIKGLGRPLCVRTDARRFRSGNKLVSNCQEMARKGSRRC